MNREFLAATGKYHRRCSSTRQLPLRGPYERVHASEVVGNDNRRFGNQIDVGCGLPGADIDLFADPSLGRGQRWNSRALTGLKPCPVPPWRRWYPEPSAGFRESHIREAIVLGHFRDGALPDFSIEDFTIEGDCRHHRIITNLMHRQDAFRRPQNPEDETNLTGLDAIGPDRSE